VRAVAFDLAAVVAFDQPEAVAFAQAVFVRAAVSDRLAAAAFGRPVAVFANWGCFAPVFGADGPAAARLSGAPDLVSSADLGLAAVASVRAGDCRCWHYPAEKKAGGRCSRGDYLASPVGSPARYPVDWLVPAGVRW